MDRKPIEEREPLNGKYFTLSEQRAYLDGIAEGYEKGLKESKEKLDLAESDVKLFLERIHYLEKLVEKLRDNIAEIADYAEIDVNEDGEPIW